MLYMYPLDNTGCGNYRALFPYNALPFSYKEQVRVIEPGESGGVETIVSDDAVLDVIVPDDCEAVFVQRPTSKRLVQVLALLRHKGVKVIVEIDDDLEALSPVHPTYTILMKHPDHDMIMPRIAAGCAHTLICSTHALAEKYGKATKPGTEVYVVPNRIPEGLIQPLSVQSNLNTEQEIRVGWPGALATHPGDLDVMRGALHAVVNKFHIVGTRDLDGEPNIAREIEYSGAIPFEDWIPELSSHLDVAVVPLKNTPFNHAKSALKALELAAAGVPMVRNTLPEFEKLGIGIPATKVRHWTRGVTSLIHDEDLRLSEIERNHEIVKQHTYEEHWEEWATAWGLQ